MKVIHIVALRNNEVTTENLRIAIDNQLWGMQTKGKHAHIHTDDAVVFLIGVSIDNLEQVKKNERYQGAFPNFTNQSIENSDFIDEFKFNVDKVLLGQVTSDFFVDDAEVWPPQISKLGKHNRYVNRFGWVPVASGDNLVLEASGSSSQFHADIIRALRDKGAQPSVISELSLAAFKGSLIEYAPENEEEEFQERAQTAKPKAPVQGVIPRGEKGSAADKKGQWKRDSGIASYVIEHANNTCEIDESHITFTSKRSGKNFVEAHHLVPMEYQGDFEASLDVPENILSLCPNCHRCFHHADSETTKNLLKQFYLKRLKGLSCRGVTIDLYKLEKYYGIKKSKSIGASADSE
jgi:hypothetical protein